MMLNFYKFNIILILLTSDAEIIDKSFCVHFFRKRKQLGQMVCSLVYEERQLIRMINDIFVCVEAYSITNGFSLLDDNYLSNATLRERKRKWDKQRNETSIHAKRSLDVTCTVRHDEILSL